MRLQSSCASRRRPPASFGPPSAFSWAAVYRPLPERRVGVLIGEMQEAGLLAKQGRNNAKNAPGDAESKCDTMSQLESIGLDRQQSSRYQREARLPDEEFDALVAECAEQQIELTQTLLLRRGTRAHVCADTPACHTRSSVRALRFYALSTHLPRKNGVYMPENAVA